MPIFDYICKSCDSVLENHYVLHHNTQVICQTCGKLMELSVTSLRSSFIVNGHNYKNGYNEVK